MVTPFINNIQDNIHFSCVTSDFSHCGHFRLQTLFQTVCRCACGVSPFLISHILFLLLVPVAYCLSPVLFQWLIPYHLSCSSGSFLVISLVPVANCVSSVLFQWLIAYHLSCSSSSFHTTYLVPVAHYLPPIWFQWFITYHLFRSSGSLLITYLVPVAHCEPLIFFQWLITGCYETEKPTKYLRGSVAFYFSSTQNVAWTELRNVPIFNTVRHNRAIFLSTVFLTLTGLVGRHVTDW
jgi:hypothetical protein